MSYLSRCLTRAHVSANSGTRSLPGLGAMPGHARLKSYRCGGVCNELFISRDWSRLGLCSDRCDPTVTWKRNIWSFETRMECPPHAAAQNIQLKRGMYLHNVCSFAFALEMWTLRCHEKPAGGRCELRGDHRKCFGRENVDLCRSGVTMLGLGAPYLCGA